MASQIWRLFSGASSKLACENIRFFSLLAAGDFSRGRFTSGEERGETDVLAGYLQIFLQKMAGTKESYNRFVSVGYSLEEFV